MPGRILLTTAYFPPVEYLSRIIASDEVLIEREENYLKQSYRNRCYILSSQGIQTLTVPVLKGSLHKTAVKDIRIDYSKRWQPVHLGALNAAYRASPFFQYYMDGFEKIILKKHPFLLDLNMELLEQIMSIACIRKSIAYTGTFTGPGSAGDDYRYLINPKISSDYQPVAYIQVFASAGRFTPNLSVIDLLFNTGPDAAGYL